MKLNKLTQNDAPYTDEMEQHYKTRTDNHINCVKLCAERLAGRNPDISDELLAQVAHHDNSKWEDPEKTPYIFITWKYKCADDDMDFEMPEGIDDHKATWHHVKDNRHHPECWDDEATNQSINKQNRGAPPQKPVDGSKMDLISLAEMVADWTAMGIERGNTAKEWADKNVNNRWLFTNDQVELIYKFIEDLEEDESWLNWAKEECFN